MVWLMYMYVQHSTNKFKEFKLSILFFIVQFVNKKLRLEKIRKKKYLPDKVFTYTVDKRKILGPKSQIGKSTCCLLNKLMLVDNWSKSVPINDRKAAQQS